MKDHLEDVVVNGEIILKYSFLTKINLENLVRLLVLLQRNNVYINTEKANMRGN